MAEDKKKFVIKSDERGEVKITEDVLAVIAGLAATETEGVESLAGNLTSDVIAKSNGNKLAKGIKIATNEEGKMQVRVAVNLMYGYEIPKVCEQIQDKIKTTVENMTGLDVVSVDIRIATVIVSNV